MYILKLYHSLPNVVGAWCNCYHGIVCVLQGEEGTQGPVGEKGDTGDKGDMVSCHCYLYLCVHVHCIQFIVCMYTFMYMLYVCG